MLRHTALPCTDLILFACRPCGVTSSCCPGCPAGRFGTTPISDVCSICPRCVGAVDARLCGPAFHRAVRYARRTNPCGCCLRAVASTSGQTAVAHRRASTARRARSSQVVGQLRASPAPRAGTKRCRAKRCATFAARASTQAAREPCTAVRARPTTFWGGPTPPELG
jgi:hypothetical protein